MTTDAVNPSSDHRSSLRIEAPCNFPAVRAATLKVRDWLMEKGMTEIDLGAWELALVEAANNAVKYVGAENRDRPVTIEISCGSKDIEAQITDHTAGFEWPATLEPPPFEAESGRGLYLMNSLMDSVVYLRRAGHNMLVMRRARPAAFSSITPDVGQLQARLAEAEASLTDMTSELASSYESLVALFRYSAELGAQSDLKDFSTRLVRDLIQIAEADCAVVRLLSTDNKKLEILLVAPENPAFPQSAIMLGAQTGSRELAAAIKRQDIWFDPREPLPPNDPLRAVMPVGNGICHPFMMGDQLVGTATLGRLAADRPFTAAQINLLHTFTDFLAIQIVNARLLTERTAAHVTRRELQIAADIQHSLLPAKIPVCPPFDLAAGCQNALQVGGDFYDLIPAGEDGVLVVIADVMGKGVPAAMFAAVLRSVIRSMPQLFSQPGELLAAANRTLYSDLSRVDMFVTAQLVYLNGKQRELTCASAGHCSLLIWKPGEATAENFGQSGLPLCIEPEVKYPQSTMPLPPGALALSYTDGLSETRNPAGELLGEQNLRTLFARAAAEAKQPETVKQILLRQINDYAGHAPLTDDQTLILIKHRP